MKTQTQQPKHTQGEIECAQQPDLSVVIYAKQPHGKTEFICKIETDDAQKDLANAKRIVKCVNGWDGLIVTIKEMLKEAEDACTFHGNNPDKSPDIIKWRNFLNHAEYK